MKAEIQKEIAKKSKTHYLLKQIKFLKTVKAKSRYFIRNMETIKMKFCHIKNVAMCLRRLFKTHGFCVVESVWGN